MNGSASFHTKKYILAHKSRQNKAILISNDCTRVKFSPFHIISVYFVRLVMQLNQSSPHPCFKCIQSVITFSSVAKLSGVVKLSFDDYQFQNRLAAGTR